MQPTQALLKRFRKLPLTTKDIKKGFYKGTRTGSMGRHTKYGGYIIDWAKVRTYVVPPGLDTFKVSEVLNTGERDERASERNMEGREKKKKKKKEWGMGE